MGDVPETSDSARTAEKKWDFRQDVISLTAGIIFIIALLGGMWGWGLAESWNAQSGYTHIDVNTSQERFMPEPYGCNDTSVPGRSGEFCTSYWYYWKLPLNESSASTRAFVWLLYSLHQIFIWGLIYRAQLTSAAMRKNTKYSTNLRWFNWGMLLVNGLFHVLHLVQTHVTYDGTAPDVTETSSQSSVIMMLTFIILMEYKTRGFILMWPNPKSDDKIAEKLRFHPSPVKLIRKYHGFAFAWASIYTFWYHPMENTWGHTLGFFHTAIVMLQGSLAFTEVHLNRYWRLINECWVLVHATVIAIQTGNPEVEGKSDLWPIFTFGFGFIFAFTQIFSLPFWKKISAWFRVIPPVLFLVSVSILCATVVAPKEGQTSGLSRIYEMVFIPAEEYMQVLLSFLFLYIFIFFDYKLKPSRVEERDSDTQSTSSGDDVNNNVPNKANPSPTKQALYLCGVMLIYSIFVLISYFHEQAHPDLNFTVSMIILVCIFSFGVCVTIMLFKQLIGPSKQLFTNGNVIECIRL